MELRGSQVLEYVTTESSDILPVRFPDDHYMHGHDVEWWYLASQLFAAGDPAKTRRYTVVFVILKRRYLFFDPALAGIARVFDHETGRVSPTDFSVGARVLSYGEDRLRKRLELNLDELRLVDSVGSYQIFSRDLGLRLTATSPLRVRLGDRGRVDYGEGHAAYWVAPRLEVEGEVFGQQVVGKAWYERQWTNLIPDDKRWRFILAQLDDGSCLSAFRFQDQIQNITLLPPEAGDGDQLHASGDEFELNFEHGENGPVTLLKWPRLDFEARIEALADNQVFSLPGIPPFGEFASSITAKFGRRSVGGWAITETKE